MIRANLFQAARFVARFGCRKLRMASLYYSVFSMKLIVIFKINLTRFLACLIDIPIQIICLGSDSQSHFVG